MRDGADGVLIGIVILALILATTGTPSIEEYERNGTISCRKVTGEIVGKEAPFNIIVEVDDNVAGDTQTYNVFVSLEAYSNYSIGDMHEESICTFTDYEYFKSIIEQLKQSGILN